MVELKSNNQPLVTWLQDVRFCTHYSSSTRHTEPNSWNSSASQIVGAVFHINKCATAVELTVKTDFGTSAICVAINSLSDEAWMTSLDATAFSGFILHASLLLKTAECLFPQQQLVVNQLPFGMMRSLIWRNGAIFRFWLVDFCQNEYLHAYICLYL